MNVWTAFFLVVSIVVLAAPLLFAREGAGRSSNYSSISRPGDQVLQDDELELDLASGRLAREDYEEMSERIQAAGSLQEDGSKRVSGGP